MDVEYYYSKYKNLLKFFNDTGLDNDEFLLYIILKFDPDISVNQLHKITGINRTKLYRHLNKLNDMGIIEITSIKPMKYKSIVLNNAIKNIIYAKEKYIRNIKNEGSMIIKLYNELNEELSGNISSDYTGHKYKFFVGFNSIYFIIKDMLTDNDNIFALIDNTRIKKFMEDGIFSSENIYNIHMLTDINYVPEYINPVNIKKIKASLYPNFIINKSKCEIFVFLDINFTRKYVFTDDQLGFWTNENNYVNKMYMLFRDLWDK